MQAADLYARVSRAGEAATGQRDLVPADEVVAVWLARLFRRDPDFFVALAEDEGRVIGAAVAEFTAPMVRLLLATSPNRRVRQGLQHALAAWARACGATAIGGWTFRNPEALARLTGYQHLRDQYVLEVA